MRQSERENRDGEMWASSPSRSRSRSPPQKKEKETKKEEKTKKKEEEEEGSGSDKEEASEEEEERKKKEKRKKKKGTEEESEASDSEKEEESDESDRNRKKRKKSKSKKKTSKRKKRKHKKKKKRTRDSSDDDSSQEGSAGDSDGDDSDHKKSSKKRRKDEKEESDEAAEGKGKGKKTDEEVASRAVVPVKKAESDEEDEVMLGDMWDDKAATRHRPVETDEFMGPKPPVKDAALDARSYGGALMPGEGEAIAGFVQAGKRIPRRGEVGVTSEQIEAYEDLGYVMSGSRHKRMNAIRIRKENQVYSAEEKRALSLLNFEEKANKEKKLMSDFRKYLQEKASEMDA